MELLQFQKKLLAFLIRRLREEQTAKERSSSVGTTQRVRILEELIDEIVKMTESE